MATLPRPSRAWTYHQGYGVAQSGTNSDTTKTLLLDFVTALEDDVGATLSACCDSLVAGAIGDGIERWFDIGDIVGATPGNPHSWRLSDLPDGLGQILFDKDNSIDQGAYGSVYWSPASGFTGGSTTARPTASDEQELTNLPTMLATTNGDWTFHLWRCQEAGKQGIRAAFLRDGTTGPILFSVEHAAQGPAVWTDQVIARWAGGSAFGGDRAIWTGTGWVSRIAGTNRQLLAVGEAPPVALDADGDRLATPCRLNSAAIGATGFVDDWYFVDDAVTNLATISDPDGARGWIVLDEVVWPWGHGDDPGGGNIAGAKLLSYYQPADLTASLVSTTPSAGAALGATFEAGRWQAVTLVFEIPDGHLPTAHVVIDGHSIWHTAYDGTAFSPLFEANSSISISGREVTMVLLPLGGWWGAPTITPGAFLEAT